MDLVLLLRLDSARGFHSMADALKVANAFQEKGIDAVAELAPGDPAEGALIFYIKVPADQLENAKNLDIEY